MQYSRQIQTQVQTQTQTLSPQQLLVVKLVELPTVELEDRVRAEILENPALEEGADTDTEANADASTDDASTTDGADADNAADTDYDSLADYRSEDDIPDYRLRENNRSPGDNVPDEIPYAADTSFYEALRTQLSELSLSEHERQLADYLIGSLDDDGLLRKPLTAIVDELAIYAGVETTEKELEGVLTMVQSIDPPGIAARDLRECLLLQLGRRGDNLSESGRLAVRILRDAYDDFARKNHERVAARLGVDDAAVVAAIKEIQRLNPRPGASMGETVGRGMQQIVPDFTVDVDDEGRITVSLNDRGVPRMRISPSFAALVDEQARDVGNPTRQQRDAMVFLKQKIDAARGFIDAVRQRRETLLSTMQAIVDLQRDYFLEAGDEARLRPMILKDVATRTGLAISTVSRVTGSKYVRTGFGTFPLRHFFSDVYVNDEGEELSVRQLVATLRRIVDEEDKSHPLTDDEIVARMNAQGFPLARRTVAKYRQQLGIPVARLRR